MPRKVELTQEEIDFLRAAVVDQQDYVQSEIEDREDLVDQQEEREDFIDEMNMLNDLAEKLKP